MGFTYTILAIHILAVFLELFERRDQVVDIRVRALVVLFRADVGWCGADVGSEGFARSGRAGERAAGRSGCCRVEGRRGWGADGVKVARWRRG